LAVSRSVLHTFYGSRATNFRRWKSPYRQSARHRYAIASACVANLANASPRALFVSWCPIRRA